MNEVQVIIRGWEDKRDAITGMVVYAENGTGRLVHAEVSPRATSALLEVPDGEFLFFAIFTAAPYRYCAESDNLKVPCAAPVVLDLDQAGIDEILVPPP